MRPVCFASSVFSKPRDVVRFRRPADNGRVWFKDKRGRKHQLLALPPSTNGLQGYISLSTLKLMQTLRQEGVIIVLISGARSSTFFQRLPWLPRADAYVCENGGRVFFPDPEGLCAAPLIVSDL